MGDNLDLPERNRARTPMQWSTEPNAGFSKNNRAASLVISSGPYGYEHVNAAQQRREPNSLLNWTERLIRMRKEVPEIGWGDFRLLATGDAAVFAIRSLTRQPSSHPARGLRLPLVPRGRTRLPPQAHSG